MLTVEDVERVDVSRLYLDYKLWPKFSRDALQIDVSFPQGLDPDCIVFAGMGGSAAAGDFLQDLFAPRMSRPIYVVKDYHLPMFVGERSFIIAVSSSGNTEETLSIVSEALARRAKIAALSSGGMLEEVCRRMNIFYTKIKMASTPRSSFPYTLYPPAKILLETGLAGDVEGLLEASVASLEKTARFIAPEVDEERNPSKRVAEWVYDGLPVIYASRLHRAAAIRFKSSLNENVKMHALVEILPELCHNDISCWQKTGPPNLKPLLIRYSKERPEVEERFEAVKEVVEASGVKVFELHVRDVEELGSMLSTLYILEFATIYAAVLRNVDPLPTPVIDRLKERLKARLNYVERFCPNLL